MSKTVNMKTNPRKQPSPDELDAFVHGNGVSTPSKPVQKEPMKRLTIDVASSLHKRIRRTCLDRDVDMATAIRRILEAQFPAE